MPGQTTGADTDPTGQRELDSDEFEEELTGESPTVVQPGWKISDGRPEAKPQQEESKGRERAGWNKNAGEIIAKPNRNSV